MAEPVIALATPGDPTSRYWKARYENVTLEIDRSRWQAAFTITAADGRSVVLIASADSFYTERDGLWLSTPEQQERYANE